MNEQLDRRQVLTLFAATMALFALFAYFTDTHSLGLGNAGMPDVWAISRYAIVAGWLAIAALIYLLRGRIAYAKSLNHALLCAGILAIMLASTWAETIGSYGIFGSAICYSVISGLLCMTVKSRRWAAALGPLLCIVQILSDFLLLFIAGEFRIH
ncbi:MAG: hypothetical protein V7677_17335 [Motiliproteus sp.]